MKSPAGGFTLLELLVVLLLLGLMGGVVGLTRASTNSTLGGDEAWAAIRGARAEAIRTGRPVVFQVADTGEVASLTALPDGSLVADPFLSIDRLKGAQER